LSLRELQALLFANGIRLTTQSINSYEHGNTVPNVDTAEALAKALKCRISTFMS